MTGALLILAVTIAIGILLWAWEKFRTQRHGPTLHHHQAERQEGQMAQSPDARSLRQESENSELSATHNAQRTTHDASICCGLHAICEKTGQINEPPVYYDDEELDRFAGRASNDYTDEETEEFRDVLLTLLPSDAPGWSISLERRRINLPADLQPELELLLSESNA